MSSSPDDLKKLTKAQLDALSPQMRLQRKRAAARIRQQRCRARKKEALMAQIELAEARQERKRKKYEGYNGNNNGGFYHPYQPYPPPTPATPSQQQQVYMPPLSPPMPCPPNGIGLPALPAKSPIKLPWSEMNSDNNHGNSSNDTEPIPFILEPTDDKKQLVNDV